MVFSINGIRFDGFGRLVNMTKFLVYKYKIIIQNVDSFKIYGTLKFVKRNLLHTSSS